MFANFLERPWMIARSNQGNQTQFREKSPCSASQEGVKNSLEENKTWIKSVDQTDV